MTGRTTKNILNMNQQPDKFFREKLADHQKPVPAGAWDRLEATLDKKNSKPVWLKMAASFLLMAAASYLLWPNSEIKPEKISSVRHSTPMAEKKSKQPLKTDVINPIPAANKKIAAQKGKTKRPDAVKEKIKVTAAQTGVQQLAIEEPNAKTETIRSVVTSEVPASNIPATRREKSITLVYTVEEVNEKYLEKNTTEQATSTASTASPLKKLLTKASDLKRDQDPIGDLRQKKNEILSLNFKRKNTVAKTNKAL
jgi:hypothetical protein